MGYSALILVLLSGAPALVQAWGAVGHEIVATIAQIHLHNSTRQALSSMLPASQGHLAPIASWADRVRSSRYRVHHRSSLIEEVKQVRMIPDYRFSGELHYTSPLEVRS
jgi:hypothetical protein